MKIALIGQKGLPAKSGGVEKHVERLAAELVAEGHEVTAYVRPHYSDPEIREWQGVRLVPVFGIRTKHLDAITHTFSATVHALFGGYDVIHFHSIGPSTLSFLPKFFCRKTAVVATFHSRDYFHAKWGRFARWCLRLSERFACRVPDRTIAISRGMTEYAADTYQAEAEYIPNGADGERTESVDYLHPFGLREERYVLSVSRLVRHKGIHYLIEAFKNLEDTGKLPNNFKLAIVGTHAETPEYERDLREMSEGRESIVFLGEQTGQALRELFSHAAVFVQPSEDEGLSIALLEAMSYGLPVIASDISGNREALERAGHFFLNRDVDDLAAKLAYLLNRPDERKMYGRLARERVKAEYSWESIARKTLSVYEEAKGIGSGGAYTAFRRNHHA